MLVQASLFVGRLCGSLVPCAHYGSVARPLLSASLAFGMLGSSGLHSAGPPLPTSPSTSLPTATKHTTTTRDCSRLLATAAGPGPDTPSSRSVDTRETWQPGQGSFAASAAEAASSWAGAANISGSSGAVAKPERQGDAGAGTLSGGEPLGVNEGIAAEMNEVFDILQEMGLQPGRRCVVGDGLAEVEVGLYLNGVKVALDMEATRPSHAMVSDAKSYALKRAARSALQAHGWHPVTLVATDWHKLDGDQKAHYLAHCINHALGMGHGGHGHGHQHGHGGSCGSGCSDPSHRH